MEDMLVRIVLALASLVSPSPAQPHHPPEPDQLLDRLLPGFKYGPGDYRFLTNYEVDQFALETEALVSLNKAVNEKLINRLWLLIDCNPFSKKADIKGNWIIASTLYFDRGKGHLIKFQARREHDERFQVVWTSPRLGAMNAEDLVPKAAGELWRYFDSRRKSSLTKAKETRGDLLAGRE